MHMLQFFIVQTVSIILTLMGFEQLKYAQDIRQTLELDKIDRKRYVQDKGVLTEYQLFLALMQLRQLHIHLNSARRNILIR